ncbi:MAG: cupin domain-containing protein [Saprospiraceae bacterium]
MDKENIIDTGRLEAYCLNLLSDQENKEISLLANQYPDIQSEINQIIHSMQSFTNAEAVNPNLKAKIMEALISEADAIRLDLNNLPLLHKESDLKAWNISIEHFEAPSDINAIHVEPIYESDKKEVFLMWLDTVITEEAHDDDGFTESFLILEGECECNFDGKVLRFKAGDYFEVPAKSKHTITNISKNGSLVKGLVQRCMAA